jgi:hypothetical protein
LATVVVAVFFYLLVPALHIRSLLPFWFFGHRFGHCRCPRTFLVPLFFSSRVSAQGGESFLADHGVVINNGLHFPLVVSVQPLCTSSYVSTYCLFFFLFLHCFGHTFVVHVRFFSRYYSLVVSFHKVFSQGGECFHAVHGVVISHGYRFPLVIAVHLTDRRRMFLRIAPQTRQISLYFF